MCRARGTMNGDGLHRTYELIMSPRVWTDRHGFSFRIILVYPRESVAFIFLSGKIGVLTGINEKVFGKCLEQSHDGGKNDVVRGGIEPSTRGFSVLCSTD
jgi:hypothetical protein